jgi:hypothetical protein
VTQRDFGTENSKAASLWGANWTPAAKSFVGMSPATVYAPVAFAVIEPQIAPAGETITTYASDCSTEKTSFVLGDEICVKVEGAPVDPDRALRRFSFVNPSGFIIGAADITSSAQTNTFTLPSVATGTYNAGGTSSFNVDNRGTWLLASTDTSDGSIRAVAAVTVSDPAVAVADMQISKTRLGTGQAIAGGTLQFAIHVFNYGPDTAQDVQFSDATLPNTKFLSLTQTAGPSFTCTTPAVGTPGTATCTRATLARGEAATFTVSYTVNSSIADGAELSDTSSVSSTTAERRTEDNSATAGATVDNPAPPLCTITCPSNITQSADAHQNGAVVTFDAPEVAGSCGSGAVTMSPASGSFFAIGSSVVTATTSSGQSCSFAVTITDNEAPSIACPANISTHESSAGSGSAVVNYNVNANDNSGNVDVSCDKPSGSSFTVAGSPHTVTCTATDNASPPNSSSCTFQVTVDELNTDCVITQADISVDSPSNACGANVTFAPAATGPSCSGAVACDHASGSLFPVGTTAVTCKTGDGASTSFNVTVNDTSAPTPNVATLPTLTGQCSVSVDVPTATDGCLGQIGGTTDDPRVYTEPGTYTVHWTYKDDHGNSSSQNQTVIILAGDTTPPVPDVATLPTVSGECSATVTEIPTATDNCTGEIIGTTSDPLTYTEAGTHTIHWKFTDSNGNTTVQNQTVIVDTTPPVITLNGASTLTVECHTSFADPGATASDNCDGNLTNSISVSGTVNANAVGTYTLTYTVSDGANTTTATRTVNVVDTTNPVITLNGSGSVTVECHTSYTDAGATASDSCAISVPVTTSGAVNINVPGTYTLTYTASDPSGNAATPVTRTVNVVDTTVPTINCPSNIVVYLPLNSTATSMPVTLPAVTATDSCDSSASVTVSHTSGAIFPVGSTTVTATATDDSGNSSSCSFTVTVLYNFTGFFSPISNLPTLNSVNAGRSIPIKFSLSGNKGLNIFAVGYPASGQIACNSNDPVVNVEETGTAGSSSLSYTTDQYNYVWKTENSWAGTCRQLVVKLNDGSEHRANFKFK